jgi:hypothetical protein
MKAVMICAAVLFGCFFVYAAGTSLVYDHKSPQAVKAATQSCTAADFSLSKLKANREYDEARLTGIVTSQCASAAGVQLKWTAFNTDGTVAFSSNFWPASTTNIPPRSDYAFEMMDTAPRGRWTFSVEPIAVNVW